MCLYTFSIKVEISQTDLFVNASKVLSDHIQSFCHFIYPIAVSSARISIVEKRTKDATISYILLELKTITAVHCRKKNDALIFTDIIAYQFCEAEMEHQIMTGTQVI